ncbi:MAG: LamG-like jellyroll fold domain-containing protein [Phycisphaerales bacterium]
MKKTFVFTAILLLTTSLALADLAGYWNFDEGSGTTVADSSGNGKNGVLQKQGSASYPAWVTGHDGTGSALNFNASATSFSNSNRVMVDISSSDKLANIAPEPSTQAFTIVMWVKSYGKTGETGGNFRYLCYTNAYDIELAIDPNYGSVSQKKFDWFYSDISADWQQMNIGTERDAQWKYDDLMNPPWYHLAISYDGNYIRKYINGDIHYMTYPGTLRAGLPVATSDLFIGCGPGYGFFRGAIDDVAVYKGCYLKREEIVKLVEGTDTPLTVTTTPVEGLLPVKNWVSEPTGIVGTAWKTKGNPALWCTGFNQDIGLSHSSDNRLWSASAWWVNSEMIEGAISSVFLWNKWHPEKVPTDVCDANVYVKDWFYSDEREQNEQLYGVEWVSEEHSGLAPEVACFAAYITPGYLMTTNTWFMHPYDPDPARRINWENKPYFRTYARFTTEGAPAGCRMRVRQYTYNQDDTNDAIDWTTYVSDPTCLKYFDEISIPILGGDYNWQVFKGSLRKPAVHEGSRFRHTPETDPNAGSVLFVISIEGGDADTRLLVDEFSPDYALYIDPCDPSFTYLEGDLDKDSVIHYGDVKFLADNWLEQAGGSAEPRNGGMLVNADFYSNYDLLSPYINDYNVVHTDPTGWIITGEGDKGIRHTDDVGYLNFASGKLVKTPFGGSISVAMNDPNGALEQTTTATAVSGQTYYAMAYVMTPGWTPNLDDWRGWKDTATMNIIINGEVKATFSRKLSRNVWRPVYGSYTATSSDAGKPIKIQFKYANTHTTETPALGYLLIGYAYLDSTMPQEWPEGRDNELTNGGFDDLSNYESIAPAMVESIRKSDNWGAWFVDDVPAPLGWVFEVPSGFNEENQVGIYASGMYGSPIPTPGVSDVAVYTTNSVKLGQVIGSLTPNTRYYMDMACGINNQNYITDTNWPLSDPNHLPKFHIELWRIPAGVTSGTTIYDAIAAHNSNYVLVAETNAVATGNIAGAAWDPFKTLSSKWQIIGTEYIATSEDNNMYLRIYGADGATLANDHVTAVKPQFAFCDAYVSTAKRVVPGGLTSFNISGDMIGDDFGHLFPMNQQKYEVTGPYNCYHAVVMGVNQGDVNGDCLINLVDFATMAEDWLQPLFDEIYAE